MEKAEMVHCSHESRIKQFSMKAADDAMQKVLFPRTKSTLLFILSE